MIDISQGYAVYIDYVYIKTHFQSDKFYWNINSRYKAVTVETYLKRKDCKLFAALKQRYSNRSDWCELLISSFLLNNRIHVSDIYFSDEVKEFHVKRLSTIKALDYIFFKDIDNIFDFMYTNNLNVVELFKSSGELPLIFKRLPQVFGGVSDETFCLLDKGFGFTSQQKIDPLWVEIAFKLVKYKPLLNYESIKLKKQIEKLLSISW